MILPLLLIIAVIVAIVMIDALRHKVLFKMGFRNIFRRKTNTVIVILGLMIATAIISSSFGVGDTMDNMVESDIYDEWQQTDVTVYNTTSEGTLIPINHTTYVDLKTDILDIDNVEGVSGEVHGSTSIFNQNSRLSQPNVRLVGMDFDESEGFNPFYKNGKSFEPELNEGEIYIDTVLAEDLEAEKGDLLLLYSSGFPQGRDFAVKDVIENKGRAAFRGSGKVIMSLSDAQLALNLPQQINYVRVTSIGGVESGTEYSDQIYSDIEDLLDENPEYSVLDAGNNKKAVLEDFKQQMSQFSDIFFIFGTFSIIAGIILAVNIFVMLGEERKSEMGMSRAIGMKRKHLRRMFSYEGVFYAAGASLIGTLLGVGITYVIFFFLQDVFAIFDGGVDMLSYFTFTWNSLILAFSAGFLLTMGTILFSVHRISKLNIVRAIRDIPEPPFSKKSRKILLLAIGGLALGALMTVVGLSADQLWIPVTGISLLIVGTGTMMRRWVGDRIAYTAVGLFLLVWWLLPLESLGLLEGYTTGIEMFILSGLFVVTAGVLIIMLNGSIITGLMEKMVGSGKGMKAVVLSAVSHPLKERFRTGMTVFIFALIIFAIIVMSMIVGIFHTNIDAMIEEQSGGYEILGVTDQDRPIDDIQQEIINNENLSIEDFDHIDSATRGMVPSTTSFTDPSTGEETTGRFSVIGVNRHFARNNSFGLSDYIDEFDSKEEVWNAVIEDHSLVITNAPPDMFTASMGPSLELNSTIDLTGEDGAPREKRVVGYMNQTIVTGLFMSKQGAEEDFGLTSNSLFFLSVKDGVDADRLGRDMNREFIQYGFQPLVIGTILREAMTAQFMFFDLFSGYMGLGLVVGIAGLGIISLRAVHERRLEIGMMRAIGFKRKMISYAFLIENSFITLIGIGLGSVLGIAIGWLLWYDGFRPMGWEFSIPWVTIITVAAIAYGAMFITAIPSANKASKVSPAEALRFD